MDDETIDLNILYKTALAGIHRAYVFMRIGALGVFIGDFDDTRLPGRKQVLVVPEPMPPEMFASYKEQYRSWVTGNGLRELIETYGVFLDEVYGYGLAVLSPPDHDRRLRKFEQASLRDKVQKLRDEMSIDGGFSSHLESLSAARNALTHGVGTVRARDCTGGNELVITWRGIELYFTGEDGHRYRVGDEPAAIQLREPLEKVTVDREKRWARGEKVELSAYEIAEISFMANYESIEVLHALREFGLRHGVMMKSASIIRGGEPNE